jgi:hypothetical protein
MANPNFGYMSILNPSALAGSTTYGIVNNVTVTGGTTNITFLTSSNYTNVVGPTLSAAGSSLSSGDVVFSNSNNVSFGMSESTITATATFAPPNQYWQPVGYAGFQDGKTLITHFSDINTQPLFFPFSVGGELTAGEIHWTMSRINTVSNLAFSVQAGIYTFANSTSINLISSTQGVFSATDGASFAGIRAYEVRNPYSTLSPGAYVLGMNFSASVTGSAHYSMMGGNTASAARGTLILEGTDQYATHASHAVVPFWGRASVSTNALPAAVAMSDMIMQGTGSNLMPPIHFDLCNHV